ncbi:MAG TPA: hypothetical protein VFC39_08630 [Acidobacteriaceae bacterium]|nr:hypothetical protein [Acidobacteriaceae bacterium]
MNYSKEMQLQDDNSQAGFEVKLTRALERRPEPVVPIDFAARVAAALPAALPARKPMQVGRTVGLAAAAVLGVALFALAPHAAPTFGNWAFDFELAVIAQLGGIAYWLTAVRKV